MLLKSWSKKDWFDYHRIDCEADLDNFISLYSQRPYFFRGVKDSSFELSSSIQRLWDKHKCQHPYHPFITEALKKSVAILRKYSQIQTHDFAVLSCMQHYGFPTPLLDFTTDLNIALFFASDVGHTQHTHLPASISIYAIKRLSQEDLINLRTLMPNLAQQAVCYGTSINPHVSYNFAKGWAVPILLNDWGTSSYTLGILNNPNIYAQKGIFIFNPTNSPLENYFDGLTSTTDTSDFRNIPYYGRMTCFDINTCLLRAIRSHLAKEQIAKNILFPDPNHDHIVADFQNLEFNLITEVKNGRL